MPHLIGAYATSPCQAAWDEAAEAAFYDGLADIAGADGFEIPFYGTALHAHEEAWLLRRLPPGWRHVVTCLPGTMTALAAARHFGLASDDAEGREAALAFARCARDAVARLNDAQGRQAVIAVELHSAPSIGPAGVRSSVASFAASLASLAALDWDGAQLLIEHCDAATPAHPPHKGFLTLDQELAALAAAGDAAIGVSINWARSVLETHRVTTAREHVAAAARAGRLAGIVFSGCGCDPASPYGAWQDTHMAHADADPHSLLTRAEIRACLAAGAVRFVGVKVGARPADMSVARRIALNRDLLTVVREAQEGTSVSRQGTGSEPS